MALAQDLLPLFYELRGLIGQFGLRPYRVYLIRGQWSGGETGIGNEAQYITEINEGGGQSPKVREMNPEQRALGQLPGGTVEIGPITPSYTGGGTDLSELLAADLTTGETFRIRLDGPGGEVDYRVTEVKKDRVLRYMITAVPVAAVA